MFSSFAKCITADSGNTLGSLAGHSKTINSIAYKPNRPFRIATGGEDFTAQLFEGPPFKRKVEKNDHTNFVQSVRYSPDGEVYVTGGSEGRVRYCKHCMSRNTRKPFIRISCQVQHGLSLSCTATEDG